MALYDFPFIAPKWVAVERYLGIGFALVVSKVICEYGFN